VGGLRAVGLLLLLPIGGGPALDPAGVLYAMGAAACWGLYIVFGKRAGHLHAGHSVSLGLLAASLVVVPVGVVHAGAALLDPKILAAGLLVALVSSAIPMSLEMMALKRLPKETFGILISMEPAVAALWAMLLLHEHLHGLQWLAIGCTVLASVGSTMTARRLKVPVTPKRPDGKAFVPRLDGAGVACRRSATTVSAGRRPGRRSASPGRGDRRTRPVRLPRCGSAGRC
jgi:inner membrane transporter RhtA